MNELIERFFGSNASGIRYMITKRDLDEYGIEHDMPSGTGLRMDLAFVDLSIEDETRGVWENEN